MSSATILRILIEVCVDSVESALAAVNGGADRLELCGNLGLGGGTTPSVGLFKCVHFAVPNTPIMVMIRPRTGDFLYSKNELDTMREDIRVFKSLGASGVVLGVLTQDGSIDVNSTRTLTEEAHGIEVTFHRAFDMTPGPTNEADFDAPLRQLAQIPNITRILTSGRGTSAPASLSTLKTLLQTSQALNAELRGRRSLPLTILPGSGINPRTLPSILQGLLPFGLSEVHLSGGNWVQGETTFRKEGMGMGVGGNGEWGIWRTSEDTIREVRKIVDEVPNKFV